MEKRKIENVLSTTTTTSLFFLNSTVYRLSFQFAIDSFFPSHFHLSLANIGHVSIGPSPENVAFPIALSFVKASRSAGYLKKDNNSNNK